MKVKFWRLMNEAGEADGGGGAATVLNEAHAAKGAAGADEAKPDTKPDAKADTKPEAKDSAKPDAKSVDKPTDKPDVKAEKPDAKPDKGYWPDDWRQKAANGDEKLAKRFERYASPEAALKALVEAQNKISSGELKSPLPKNATPEEVKQWRQDNGIPEAPDKYDLKFESGLVIGDDDKPIVDGFLKIAHERNLKNEDVKPVLEWYYKEQERQAETRQQMDNEDREKTIEELREEWGSDFKKNQNAVKSLLNTFPEEVRDLFAGGRLSDGTAIFNHPQVLRAFASMAREINPASTVVPSTAGDPAKTINDEISAIEKIMGTPEYIKDEAKQARYRELITVREKMKAKV